MKKINISWAIIEARVADFQKALFGKPVDVVMGIARGGIIPASMLVQRMSVTFLEDTQLKTVDPFVAGCFDNYAGKHVVLVDDIADTGATLKFFQKEAEKKEVNLSVLVVVDKDAYLARKKCTENVWFIFPWEQPHLDSPGGRAQATAAILRSINEDLLREGLVETPERVAKMWDELSSGYSLRPEEILAKKFSDEDYDEMVVLKDIKLFSMCEHHMLPIIGRVHFAYIPDKEIVGVSKIVRLVNCFAKRLQIQERLTMQIGKAFDKNVKTKGVGVIIEATHLCMLLRGVKQDAVFKTSFLSGEFRESSSTRMEFLKLTGQE